MRIELSLVTGIAALVGACFSPDSSSPADSDTDGTDTNAGSTMSTASVGETESADETESVGETESAGETEPASESDSGDPEDAFCGDGVVDGAEVCDDGINDGSYGGCAEDCSRFGPYCGDGAVHADEGEACDDGDQVDGNGCNVDCVVSGSEIWTQTHSSDGSYSRDSFRAVAALSAGGVVAIGAVRPESNEPDTLVRVYGADGELTEGTVYEGFNLLDASADNGGAYALYRLGEAGAAHGIESYDASHVQLWTATLPNTMSWFNAIAGTQQVAGGGTTENALAWVLSYDANGDVDWEETTPGWTNVAVHDVAIAPNGDVVFSGREGSTIHVRRRSPSGATVWNETVDSGGTSFTQVAVDVSGNVALVSNPDDPFLEVHFLDADGKVEAEEVYEHDSGSRVSAGAVAFAPAGTLIVVGSIDRTEDLGQGWDILAVKFDTEGQVLWDWTVAGDAVDSDNDDANAVAVDEDGYVYVAGTADEDMWIRKVAP
jgi:cysteine-rich repeat protein